MKILIVEDDLVMADALVSSMRQAGYTAELLTDGEEADDFLSRMAADLVILDLGLPKMDGLHVLRRLRNRKNHVPVLVLTARDSLSDRIKGLDHGADDYLTKPFELEELEARVRALLRRGFGGSSNQISFGPLLFDIASRLATIEDQPLELSAREASILELLLRRQGTVVSKDQIRDSLCNLDEDVSDNAIEVYFHRLRKKLEGSGITIRTIRGIGYLMDSSKHA